MENTEKGPTMTDAFNSKLGESPLKREIEYHDYIYPKISIVIPTLNNSQNIAVTLNRLLKESYPDFEVIIIDAGSTDRTLEIINSFFDSRVRICSVTTYQLYEMLNKGISLATGEYINFLAPGDFHLSPYTIKTIMDLVLENNNPHLAYGACLLRDGKSEPRILYRELSASLLKKGLQPTSIQTFWFHKDLFSIIGKFRTHFKIRGELDLFCRFALSPGLQQASTSHVIIDFDLKRLNLRDVILHFKETFQIVYSYFGFFTAFKWLFIQKDIGRMIKLWFYSIKMAFVRAR